MFQLSEENVSIRNVVREFALKELAPGAAERDEKELFCREIYDKMGQLGLLGLPYPETYGGGGCDYISYAIAVEEISRVCASTGIGLSVHVSLCAGPIYQYGTEEQRQKYLRPLAEGTKLGAFGLTEPNAGTDIGGGSTTAVRDGDDYILNGSNILISNVGVADIEVVFSSTY